MNDDDDDKKEFNDSYEKAIQGDIEAQYEIACYYYYGYDVSSDFEKAFYWY
jgi:TPR repeat protein